VKPSAHTASPIDVHLMVKPVDSLVPMFAKAGADIITFHPEASAHRPPGPDQGIPARLVWYSTGFPLYLDHVMDKNRHGC
jgi:ribulose-phosphate 3-epimerase